MSVNIKKLVLYISLYNSGYAMAQGLPANPPEAPSANTWISVPSAVPQGVIMPSASQPGAIPATVSAPANNVTQIGNSFFEQPVHENTIPAQGSAPTPELQIGNSFFESGNAVVIPIHQIGIAYEDRPNLSDMFIYYNQLLSNNLFYEIRAYAAYNYQANNPNMPSLPLSNQANPMGYGFVGILGYVVPLNGNVSLMPFLRLTYFNNFFAVYSNSNGNSINSSQYIAQPGARLSMKVNNVFAIYTSYWIGYQNAYLNGTGVYATTSDAQIGGIASTLEIGFPYKMTKRLSIAPYVDFNVNANNPNTPAASAPYNATAVTNTNTFLAVKLGYDF